MAAYDPAVSYKIINKKSGRALSVRGAVSYNGSQAMLWDWADAEDQFWHIVDVGGGFYKFLNNHSGRALSTLNADKADRTIIHIWDDLNTFDDQHWMVTPASAGFVKITRKDQALAPGQLGGAVSCLDGETVNGTTVHLFHYTGQHADQEWTITPVPQRIDVDARVMIGRISPYLSGVCLEDVNHEVYGGIYSQMIFGESFQEPAPLYNPTTIYKLFNKKSGKALSIRGGGTTPKTPAIISPDVEAADQFWRIVEIERGFYNFVNVNSGQLLSTLDGGSRNNTPVHIHPDLNTFPDQHWSISPGGGFVSIRNRNGRRFLCCVNGGTTHDTPLHLYDFAEGAQDQLWTIVPISTSVYDSTATYTIVNKKSHTALSIDASGTSNGSRAILRALDDSPDQRWRLMFIGDGYYRLVNVASNRLLSTINGGSNNGTLIHIWDDLTTYSDQHWCITPDGSGFATIRNRNGRGVVSCLDGGTANGTPIHLWEYLGGYDDQEWEIRLATDITRHGVSGMWRALRKGTATGRYQLDTSNPFKGLQSQWMSHTGGRGEIGIENQSLHRWGMHVQAGKPYRGYVYLRVASPTTVYVAFESADGARVYTETSILATPGVIAIKSETSDSEWKRYDFTITPNATDTHARFAIKLKRRGNVAIGHAYVEPDAWGRFADLPVRRDIAEQLVAQGNRILRFGGTSVKHDQYRWQNMTGPRDLRLATGGFWYPYESNGWGIIDFLNFAEAAGMVGIPAINMSETKESVELLIDYVNGAAGTEGAQRRIGDGHEAPYALRYLQLGNEETVDLSYAARFKELAEIIWLKDPDIILIVGDFSYDHTITDPFCFTGAPKIHSLQAHKVILDLAASHGREVWFDCHIWVDNAPGGGGEQRYNEKVREQVDALRSLYVQLRARSPHAVFKLVVFELNADRYDIDRALGNALALGMMKRLGIEIAMVASANALQPDDLNDNGWNQGLLFFDPVTTWRQPAYFVTQMKSQNYLPWAVWARVSGRESLTFDVTATTSADGTTLVLHVVNAINVARTYEINLVWFVPRDRVAQVTTLQGPPGHQNTPAAPNAIAPQQVNHPYVLNGNSFTFTFAPNSFTIVRLQ